MEHLHEAFKALFLMRGCRTNTALLAALVWKTQPKRGRHTSPKKRTSPASGTERMGDARRGTRPKRRTPPPTGTETMGDTGSGTRRKRRETTTDRNKDKGRQMKTNRSKDW